MKTKNAFLVVRHGPGRGRLHPYIQQCFDTLREGDPVLRDRLVLHETGQPEPSLDRIQGILFLLADPLESLYPACFEEAAAIAERARRSGIPVYNPPEVLSDHSKSRTAILLAEAGIHCPPARTYGNHEELSQLLRAGEFPVILRADVDHAQVDACVLEDADAATNLEGVAVPLPGVISAKVDVRTGRRPTGRPDPFRRWVHRYRAFVFGDVCMPGHLHFSSSWVVGHRVIWDNIDERSRTIHKKYGPGRANGVLQRAIRADPWYRAGRAADISYRRQGPPDPELFVRAARVLGYDFVAFDFGRFPDGRPVIFEANPYPFINSMPGGILWRERELDEYTGRMYDAVGKYLHSRLEG
jgi:hypothetical protein